VSDTSNVHAPLVIPATARAGARANGEAGPKGERQDGASQAGIQLLAFAVNAELPLACGERVTFRKAKLPRSSAARVTFAIAQK
jgi:hypothetical protein